jgi:serine-type D-Ala-D-Ala carboxypeptidase/endopeptidase
MSYIALVPGGEVGSFVAVNRLDFAMFYGLTNAASQLLAGWRHADRRSSTSQ